MGYYLPPKSYLRPKPRVNLKQKAIAITAASIMLLVSGIIFTTFHFESINANANVEVKNKKTEVIIPIPLVNTNPVISEREHIIESDMRFPVQLAYFKVVKDIHFIELRWSTTLEYKNQYFIIEKSSNGTNFKELGTVESKKSNEKSSDYSFVDNDLSEGVIFYRLRQVSSDEKSTYIALEKIILNSANEDLTLYIEDVGPQPFEKYFNINYFSDREGGISVELFDKSGKKIYKTYTEANQGYNTCRFIEGQKLTDDEYTVRIANSAGAYVKKIKKRG